MRLSRQDQQGEAAVGGFTLIELLVASAIAAILIGTLAGVLAGGLRVWERARRVTGPHSLALLGMETLERDLRNAAWSRFDILRGDRRSVTIPAVWAGPSLDVGEGVGTVHYRFDSAGHHLVRQVSVRLLGGSSRTMEKELVLSADQVSFAYAEAGYGESGMGMWRDAWDNVTNRPAAVRVIVRAGEGGDRIEVDRTIVLPCRQER